VKTLCLIVVSAGLAVAQSPAGAIEGAVQDAATHGPIKKAIVTTWSMTPLPQPQVTMGRRRFQQPGQITAQTDAGGAFALRDLPAGTYQLNFSHPRYPQFGVQVSKSIEVKAGETARVSVELIPGATISGRVVDEDGDPLADCSPQVISARAGGYTGFLGNESSNAAGVYTVWGINPGKYKLLMSCGSPVLEGYPLQPIAVPPPPPSLAYPHLFYPGVPDAQQAQLIEVAAGQDRTGIDFQLKPVRVFTVKGTLRPGNFDMQQVSLTLMPRNQLERDAFRGAGGTVDPQNGTVTFQRVFPGSYNAVAILRDESGPKYGVRQPVEVPGPAQLELELKPGLNVSGKVEVEGEFKNPLSSINVQLVEMEPVGMGVATPKTSEDGGFTIPSILPGLYRVQVYGPGVFVKSLSWGGTELAGDTLDIGAGGSGPLRILVSTKTGTIKGTGPAGRVVEAVEAGVNQVRMGTATDPQGAFIMGGLRPGKYRVMLGGFGMSDENAGEEITVGEGETVTVTVRDPGAR
jgi:protocatechuate 3,4-dioxygenase beta subunit